MTTSALAQGDARPASRQRADIPAQFRWDFSPIFASWEAWEAGLRDMETRMDAFARLEGTLARGPQALLDAYKAYDEIGKLQYRVYRFPQLQRDVDTRDQAVSGRFQRVGAVFARFEAATSWFTPELLKIPEATVRAWLDATPALTPYRYTILDQFRRQAHVLDARGERLMALTSRAIEAPRRAYEELSTSDIRFPEVTLSSGRRVTASPGNYYAELETNRVQADRGALAAAHMGAYAGQANTYAALYDGVLQAGWFNAQARQFKSVADASLHEHAVPRAVLENLVATTRAGTAPLQRYTRLRKKLLGLEQYHPYDSFVGLMRSDRTYPYALARQLALESVAPLGPEYVDRFKRFVAGGRIDVYETDGKRSGAYNAGVYGVGPYLLLNHVDTLDSMFTFAHEAGHALHTVLSFEHQPFATSAYTIFVAEVASTTNERFLLEHLLARTDDPRERFLLLQHAVDQIVSTFYTQVLFADFELRAHHLVEQGQPVTAGVLDALYLQTYRDYHGDTMTVDDFYKSTWARIGHFFRTPFYVYQYATCFASSAQLFAAMTTGSESSRREATGRYLELLKSGGSDEPMKLLKKAGVDLEQRATVQAVVDQLDRLVTRMEAEAARLQ